MNRRGPSLPEYSTHGFCFPKRMCYQPPSLLQTQALPPTSSPYAALNALALVSMHNAFATRAIRRCLSPTVNGKRSTALVMDKLALHASQHSHSDPHQACSLCAPCKFSYL